MVQALSSVAMLVAALVAASLVTAAPTPQHHAVRDGVLAYEALDYRSARGILEGALASDGLSPDDRFTALAYLGRCLAVLGKTNGARRRFVQVLELAPQYEVSRQESPRIREAFDAAKAEVAERLVSRPPGLTRHSAAPALEVSPPPAAGQSAGAQPGPTTPVVEEQAAWSAGTWWVGAAILAAAAATAITLIVVTRGEPEADPTARWRLP